jgi:hypothetical protein
VVIAIIETLAALALIFQCCRMPRSSAQAILSFGIWSGAEAFHLPFHSGMTDLGPSVGYIFASLALFFAAPARPGRPTAGCARVWEHSPGWQRPPSRPAAPDMRS